MSLVHTLTLKKPLPLSDVKRVEEMVQALQSGGGASASRSHSPRVIPPRDAQNHGDGTLSAGSIGSIGSLRSMSRRRVKKYYRVNEHGTRVSSRQHTGHAPMQVARSILARVLRRQLYKYPSRYRGLNAPVSVRSALKKAVEKEWLTPHQAQVYLDTYEGEKACVAENRAVVFIQQAGIARTRQYEGWYEMVTRPTRAQLVNGETKRVVVQCVHGKKNRSH